MRAGGGRGRGVRRGGGNGDGRRIGDDALSVRLHVARRLAVGQRREGTKHQILRKFQIPNSKLQKRRLLWDLRFTRFEVSSLITPDLLCFRRSYFHFTSPSDALHHRCKARSHSGRLERQAHRGAQIVFQLVVGLHQVHIFVRDVLQQRDHLQRVQRVDVGIMQPRINSLS